MLFFWGTKVRRHPTAETGDFFCPTCSLRREYTIVRLGKYFCPFFIPMIETEDLGTFVECGECHDLFEREVIACADELELDYAFVALRIRLQLGFIYQDEIDRLVRLGMGGDEAVDMVLLAVSKNEEFRRADDDPKPDGPCVSCLSCKSRLELYDHQVAARRFTCPICDIRWLFH